MIGVVSPYGPAGAVAISRDRSTAFATINYNKPANLVPNDAGKPVLDQVNAVKVPGLSVAAGGQVISNAQGFSVGPATLIGAIAALVILLFTFGSLIAAGMPLITAAFGLITGVALIGLATHVTSIPNVSTDLALMIGLGVGVDYALFIVTRFRENYVEFGDVERSVVEAMDTCGPSHPARWHDRGHRPAGHVRHRGQFPVRPLDRVDPRRADDSRGVAHRAPIDAVEVRTQDRAAADGRGGSGRGRSGRAGEGKIALALAPVEPDGSGKALAADPAVPGGDDCAAAPGLRPASRKQRRWQRSRQHQHPACVRPARRGLRARLQRAIADRGRASEPQRRGATGPRGGRQGTPNVVAVTPARLSPAGNIAVFEAYPGSAPQAAATTDLVNHLRNNVAPPLERQSGNTVLVGGFTAGSIDFSDVLAGKLPLFIGIVVVLSALLLFVMFRSIVIPIQAALMNLLSIGGAIGVTVLVFQNGWFASVIGIEKGPVEPWIPVLMFAVVFGLSMDYEVFLISRVREQWIRKRDASEAVADGIALTGRVITAAAAIMICVFLSFMFGNQRVLKEFGFGLAAAVLLDAIVVRCVLLPAVLELLGPRTWWLPRWLDRRLPHINIEGKSAHAALLADADEQLEREPAQV